MSLECSECEHDLRGGHLPECPRFKPPELLEDQDGAPFPEGAQAAFQTFTAASRENNRALNIQFYTPLNHHEPFTYREPFFMSVVPRIGERIMFEEGGYEYMVQMVCYTPNEPDFDAYVSLR